MYKHKTPQPMNQNPEVTVTDIAKAYLEDQISDPINKLLSDFFDSNSEAKKSYLAQIQKEFYLEKSYLENFNDLINLASNKIEIKHLKIKKNNERKDGTVVYHLSFSEKDLSLIEFYAMSPLLKTIVQLKSNSNEDFILHSRRELSNFEFDIQFKNHKGYKNEDLIKPFIKKYLKEKLNENNEILENIKSFFDSVFVMKNAVLSKIPDHILYSDTLEGINLLNVKEEDFDLIKLKNDIDLRETILYVKNYIYRMNKTLENKIKI